MRAALITGLVGALAGGTSATQAGEDVAIVEVQGEGISPDSARKDALRKALEQCGETEIFSHTHVKNFQLIRDTIYARAEGIVTEYRVLEEGEGFGGAHYCRIRAAVDRSAIASDWGSVQNLLDQIGRPGVMVSIIERIDGSHDTSSILESKIEARLIKSGFAVYSKQGLDSIRAKEAADAAAEDDVVRMQALAKDHNAQIFIIGHAHADAAGVENLYGIPAAMYNGDCVVKMYYTDTARLLASESLANWRGGARGHYAISPVAGKVALANAGDAIVQKVYATVMQQWATAISAGMEIQLEIQGLTAAETIKIKDLLQTISGIESINSQGTKGLVRFRIVGKMTAEALVAHLVAGEWENLIEVEDWKLNRIQAKAVGG